MSSSSNNKKVLYQLWTNGKGSFAVGKIGSQLFEYSDSQYSYDKILDSKMLYDGSITEELVQDWIQELKQEDILDEDGNLILCQILILLLIKIIIFIQNPVFINVIPKSFGTLQLVSTGRYLQRRNIFVLMESANQ